MVAVGNQLYWVSKGHLCLYILHKVEIWSNVTDAFTQTLKDKATQLLIKYKVNRCLARYSPRAQPPTDPPTGH